MITIILTRILLWWKFRHECGWFRPRRYLRGNPWASNITTGICPRCLAKEMAELRERKKQLGKEP
jgi:hypothetical protein